MTIAFNQIEHFPRNDSNEKNKIGSPHPSITESRIPVAICPPLKSSKLAPIFLEDAAPE
jgi:hypothetical protein